jgi:hypothetical protein
MTRDWLISRRTALKGLGATLALPLLDSMGWAEAPAAAGAAPTRLAFIYVPHGVDNERFWPAPEVTTLDGELPVVLAPLAPLKQEILVLGGLHHRNAEGDNRGHHARETATWLTGFSARADSVHNAESVDQIFARRMGAGTKLPSLELGLQAGRPAGNCDQGFSCAYHSHISWRSPTQPNPRELDPRAVFDRLFASTSLSGANAYGEASLNGSILDLVRGSAQALGGSVGGDDRRKLDEYLDSVRSVEARIQGIERKAQERAGTGGIDLTTPAGIPERFDDYAQLMLDLIVLAWQTDSTRVATLMFSQAFGRSYPEIGVPENHHEMSHHQWNPVKLAKVCQINTYHVAQFAHLLRRLAGTREGAGTLLDHSLVLYGSGMGDGDRHDHQNLPTILAGHAGGLRTGRHVARCQGNFSDLLIGMMELAGCPIDRLGDGTKALPDLS